MKPWPKYPLIYEINSWVWLHELGIGLKDQVTLATVPEKEWDAIAALNVDAVWFMGVWERSPAGIEIAMRNPGLLEDFRRALPDFFADDNVGSPYCVRDYVVDPHLGGPEGLAIARAELAKRGIGLILDFVPNHVAPDHPWVTHHPDYFIKGNYDDSLREPGAFIATAGQLFACGRDPFFPAWPDVLQLNAFNPGLRASITETVKAIADQCDGVRCDMAMLVMNEVFEQTWGSRAGVRPADEYWPGLISEIRRSHPGFIFMAEAYWDLEWRLQQQGFDFCYDKKLYDRLEQDSPENVRLHLYAEPDYQNRLIRFIENHDEPRAAASFPDGKGRAAALAILTLPGARLLHEGQFEGRKVRLPVFLCRRPVEPVDHALAAFYEKVLQETAIQLFRKGDWQLCEWSGWPDNKSCRNILAWCWVKGEERALIVVNFSDMTSQALVKVPWDELRDRIWRLEDRLAGESFERSGYDMREVGLYIELEPWQCHLFKVGALQ